MGELCRGLNHPHPMNLTKEEVELFWTYWEAATRALRVARSEQAEDAAIRPLMVKSIRPAVGGRRSAALAWLPTPEGRLVLGAKRPSALGLRPAVELVDYARKIGTPWRIFRRLRRCAQCQRFFDDAALRAARYPNAYHGDECREDARTRQRATAEAQAKAAKRVRRHRARRAGLDAPPGKCRAPDLISRPGQEARLKVLIERDRLPKHEAEALLDREVGCVQRTSRV